MPWRRHTAMASRNRAWEGAATATKLHDHNKKRRRWTKQMMVIVISVAATHTASKSRWWWTDAPGSRKANTHSKDSNNDEPSSMKMEKNESATAATRQEKINRWWCCWSMLHGKEGEKKNDGVDAWMKLVVLVVSSTDREGWELMEMMVLTQVKGTSA